MKNIKHSIKYIGVQPNESTFQPEMVLEVRIPIERVMDESAVNKELGDAFADRLGVDFAEYIKAMHVSRKEVKA